MAPAEMKELLIIGAGPHSLTCLLRLLEPDADFSVDDKKRRAASVKTVRARCACRAPWPMAWWRSTA